MTDKQKIRFVKRAMTELELSTRGLAVFLEVHQPRVVEWTTGRKPIAEYYILAIECLLRREKLWPLT